MSEKLTPATIENEFTEINKEIERLKAMIKENQRLAQACYSRNSHLREAIKALDEKRMEIIFADRHVRPC